jgi:fumarylacetoacetate (FAA) hydrolase
MVRVWTPNAGVDMTFDFATLVAHVREDAGARSGQHRRVGNVSNKEAGGRDGRRQPAASGIPVSRSNGRSETLVSGKPATPFMRFGDRIRIEMLDAAGHSIFGAIDQRVRALR